MDKLKRHTIRVFDPGHNIIEDPDGQWIFDPDHQINLDQLLTSELQSYRRHACWSCKNLWEAPVVLSNHTQNLSGEKRQYCPQCGKQANAASPTYQK